MSAPRANRIRLRFSKWGPIRFTSHRDVARMWERSLRRISLPVSYSEGFSPRPRLRFGLALGTAYESCGEYLDVDLQQDADVDLDGLTDAINETLPPGMTCQGVVTVAPGGPSLQEAVTSCHWLIELLDVSEADATAVVDKVMAAPELPVTRERKGKVVTDDIRPALLALRIVDAATLPPAAPWVPEGALLEAELATQPRTCRPTELLVALTDAGLSPEASDGRVVRTHQWTMVDDRRCEPLPLGTAALAQASSPAQPHGAAS